MENKVRYSEGEKEGGWGTTEMGVVGEIWMRVLSEQQYPTSFLAWEVSLSFKYLVCLFIK